MFMAISNVSPDGGPLAVVPGSHRLKYGPWETLRRTFRCRNETKRLLFFFFFLLHFVFVCVWWGARGYE